MDQVPALRLRVCEESELLGIDDEQIGEFAVDYIALQGEVPQA